MGPRRDRLPELMAQLEEVRSTGDEHSLTEALLRASLKTALFSAQAEQVRDWIRESMDLGVRAVLRPDQEVRQLLRSAEVFLATGFVREAAELARQACGAAESSGLPGLEDRAWMVSARALVRLERQDEAVSLFDKIVARDVAADQEDPVVPGLAFLAVGEAHLFEGQYEGAHGPLERALGRLPTAWRADRLRFDALIGLGMVDQRMGELDSAALRYEAALELADAHASPQEQVHSLLLLGSLRRGQGQRAEAHTLLKRALELSDGLRPPIFELQFPTERLRNLVGLCEVGEAIEGATELARRCGGRGDLMGYVQLTSVVAALTDLDGRTEDARELLESVANGLEQGGQEHAAEVVRSHREGYDPA